jgi:hypothetical protein
MRVARRSRLARWLPSLSRGRDLRARWPHTPNSPTDLINNGAARHCLCFGAEVPLTASGTHPPNLEGQAE